MCISFEISRRFSGAPRTERAMLTCPLCKNDLGSIGLTQVRVIPKVAPGWPDRKTVDVVARALDRFDLAANE